MLKTQVCCEVDDLIEEVMEKTGKTYDEIEDGLMDIGFYPESTKTCVGRQTMFMEGKWLYTVIVEILDDLKMDRIYITHAI